MSDDMIPTDEALDYVQRHMEKTARMRRGRDTYKRLWEAADSAFRAYVAEVVPMIAGMEATIASLDPTKRTEAANAARRLVSDEHAARARSYRAAGKTYTQIGARMAADDGRPDDPYSRTTVKRWLDRPQKV